MENTLKPCPFCGNRVHLWECESRTHRYSNYRYCVVCNTCDLLFGYDEDYGGIFETEQEATEAWNTRTELEDQEETSRRCTYYEANGKEPCCTHSCQGCTWYC